jgi:hypothetical protein
MKGDGDDPVAPCKVFIPYRTTRLIACCQAAAVAMVVALSACASKPPVTGYCEWFQRTDFTDTGLRGLNKHNKEAVLVNENTAKRLKCP